MSPVELDSVNGISRLHGNACTGSGRLDSYPFQQRLKEVTVRRLIQAVESFPICAGLKVLFWSKDEAEAEAERLKDDGWILCAIRDF